MKSCINQPEETELELLKCMQQPRGLYIWNQSLGLESDGYVGCNKFKQKLLFGHQENRHWSVQTKQMTAIMTPIGIVSLYQDLIFMIGKKKN